MGGLGGADWNRAEWADQIDEQVCAEQIIVVIANIGIADIVRGAINITFLTNTSVVGAYFANIS